MFYPDGNNTYSGGTTIGSDASLILDGTSSDPVGSGAVDNYGNLELGRGGTSTLATNITGDGNILFFGGGTTIYTGTCSDSGSVQIWGGELLVDGDFSSTDNELTLMPVNTPLVVLGGTGTISGSVYVDAGGALVPGGTDEGLTISGSVTIEYGGTLGSSIGGDNTGILTIGNLVMQSGSNLSVQANGVTAGSGYSQVDVTGTASISEANIQMLGSLSGFQTSALAAIDCEDASSVSISFLETSAQLNGNWYTVNTNAGSGGKDVTLTAGHIVSFAGELVVDATGSDDLVSVSQNDSDLPLTIVYDGSSESYSIPSAGLFIYTRGGSDETIDIAPSVSCTTTVETINLTGSASISSGSSSVTVWDDSNDSFSYTGTGSEPDIVHTVTSLAGGISLATGASLIDPYDLTYNPKNGVSGTLFHADTYSLWGSGPQPSDVNQGSAGDCYFMASLAAFALVKPEYLMQSAVDMGDGTYIVEFHYGSSGAPVYVRVSNDLSTGAFGPSFESPNGFLYGFPSPGGPIWASILEKAFAYFRYYVQGTEPSDDSSPNSYVSIWGGGPQQVYLDFGISDTTVDNTTGYSPLSTSESATDFYNLMSSLLADNEPVTFCTPGDGDPDDNADRGPDNQVVLGHCYTLVGIITGGDGTVHYELRNPWGYQDDENLPDGIIEVTFSQIQQVVGGQSNFSEIDMGQGLA